MQVKKNISSTDGEPPLNDVRVLDLSRLVSGNLLTHVLADLGATVIKVEAPQKGDELRAWKRDGVSTYWLTYGRNKDSVELDLRKDEGMQHLKRLLSESDILVENFRPGTLERMGLTKEVLQEIRPGLIVVRISGWGQTGPFAHKGGFGSLIEAMSGFAAMNGYADRPPVLPPFALADSVAGVYGASVALACLHERNRSNNPELREIDLSLFEPLFSFLGPQAAEYQLTGRVTPRSGSRSPTHAPRNVYRTRDDKWIALSAGMEGTLARLFDGIGYPDGLLDPRFCNHEARLANIDALDDLIQGHIIRLDLDQALEFFESRDITAGPVCDIADLLTHPYVKGREFLVDQITPDGRKVSVHAPPYKINGHRPSIRRQAPSLGQDDKKWLHSSEKKNNVVGESK